MTAKPGAHAVTYSTSWRHFRRWYRAAWVLFALWVPVGIAVTRSTERLREPGLVILPFMLLWAAAWLTCVGVARAWPCPRCGQRFFIKPNGWRMPILVTRRCSHCGLRKYADLDATVPQPNDH